MGIIEYVVDDNARTWEPEACGKEGKKNVKDSISEFAMRFHLLRMVETALIKFHHHDCLT